VVCSDSVGEPAAADAESAVVAEAILGWLNLAVFLETKNNLGVCLTGK
jgi:hypothetical protein